MCDVTLGACVNQSGIWPTTIELLAIVFPQMPVCFSAYITYDWDLNIVRHPNGPALAQ